MTNIKEILIVVLSCFIIIAVTETVNASPVNCNGLYPRVMYVTEVDRENDIFYCVDLAELTWVYYGGTEDIYADDTLAMLMYDNGTPDWIYDDIIIDWR